MMIFDYKKALAISDGDVELLKELITIFKDQIQELLDELGRAIQADNKEGIRQTAHTLKGAAGNIGAMAVYELALSLETVENNDDISQAEKLFEKLKSAVAVFEQSTVTIEGITAQ